ncbi:hypothetical protein GJAV_G00099800 [Gymnothorax javanicus]|nr:hypothetical protein GJAV_G00099800 [Gymnothorax javanicus]
MHSRRLVKRSILGSRVYAPSPTGDGSVITGVVQAVIQENKDALTGPRRNVYTVLMQDGSLKEYSEDEIAVGPSQMAAKGLLKSSLKSSCNGREHLPESQKVEANGPSEQPEDLRENSKSVDHARSVCLLEQKRKVVSSSIDVPHARKSDEEVDMDKVTAAMVLTSLSTSPLVRSPPVKVNECLNGSWKDGGFTPSSYSSSGYWSWSAPSDQSNPSTPSPPLSADSFKPFRMPSAGGAADDVIDEPDGSSLLFDEPIPRKRKVEGPPGLEGGAGAGDHPRGSPVMTYYEISCNSAISKATLLAPEASASEDSAVYASELAAAPQSMPRKSDRVQLQHRRANLSSGLRFALSSPKQPTVRPRTRPSSSSGMYLARPASWQATEEMGETSPSLWTTLREASGVTPSEDVEKGAADTSVQDMSLSFGEMDLGDPVDISFVPLGDTTPTSSGSGSGSTNG